MTFFSGASRRARERTGVVFFFTTWFPPLPLLDFLHIGVDKCFRFPTSASFGLMTVFTDELMIFSLFLPLHFFWCFFLIGGGSFPGHF